MPSLVDLDGNQPNNPSNQVQLQQQQDMVSKDDLLKASRFYGHRYLDDETVETLRELRDPNSDASKMRKNIEELKKSAGPLGKALGFAMDDKNAIDPKTWEGPQDNSALSRASKLQDEYMKTMVDAENGLREKYDMAKIPNKGSIEQQYAFTKAGSEDAIAQGYDVPSFGQQMHMNTQEMDNAMDGFIKVNEQDGPLLSREGIDIENYKYNKMFETGKDAYGRDMKDSIQALNRENFEAHNPVKSLSEFFNSLGKEKGEQLTPAQSQALDKLVKMGVFGTVNQGLQHGWDATREGVNNFVSNPGKSISDMGENIGNAFEQATGGIRDFVNDPQKSLSDMGDTIGKAFGGDKEGAKPSKPSLSKMMKAPSENTPTGIMLDALIQGSNSISGMEVQKEDWSPAASTNVGPAPDSIEKAKDMGMSMG